MKKIPKVLLVYPPNQLMPIETPRPDGSLGPLYLAGALEKIGIDVDILDASVGAEKDNLESTFYKAVMQPNGLIRIGMSAERLREHIASGGYNIVGITSNFTSQTRMVVEVAKAAKEVSPEILVIAGGVNSRNLSERFLRSGCVDAICLTEGEKIIVRLVEAWASGAAWEGVDGIVYERDGRHFLNPPKPDSVYSNLDKLPLPLWQKLPLDKYAKIASPHGALPGNQAVRYAPLMTSRGCPFHCAYCHISLEKKEMADIGSLRLKSVERVMIEVDILKSLNIRKIYIEDDSLLAKKTRVKAIFERMLSLGFKIADMNGINLIHLTKKGVGEKLDVDADYLELLCAAGLREIVFPVESASQRILDKYASGKLNHNRLDVIELVKIAKKIGMTCPINMMIGFPDETEDEIMQSIELGRKLVEAGSEYCTFFIPIPFPGSRLYQLAISGGYLDSDFDPDLMNWKNVIMRNTIVPPQRIVELRDWAWRTVNTREHVERRLKESAGVRWNPGN